MKIYDSKANLVKGKLNIGNGSILQINYMPKGYKMAGDDTTKVGCKCYLNAVMVHKLEKYSGSDPGFKAVEGEGGFTYNEDSESTPDFKPGEAGNGETNF